jgi:hypothetical protein
VQAIHRIPGKDRGIRPVIVKVKNTEVNINIMRKKRNLKKDFRFHDDITQSNYYIDLNSSYSFYLHFKLNI